jgi:DNA repair exonuclease SbcCD ATPase subunit
MRLFPRTCILLGLTVLLACGGGEDAGRDRERARLDTLEQRLGALEQRLTSIDKELPSGERLRNDLQELERRLAAAESKAAQALETAKSAPPAPAQAPARRGARRDVTPEPGRPDTVERRAQLETLMTEYRRRLDELRHEPAGSPADQMAARRALREWYVARRRAIIAGAPLPD